MRNRFPVLLLAGAMLAGCGDSAPETQDNRASVTVALPPPLPATDAPVTKRAEPEKAKQSAPEPKAELAQKAAPERKAAPEPKAEAEPPEAEATTLVEAAPPIPRASLARHIKRIGFDCDEVATVTQVQTEGGRRAGIYKFDCRTGGSYQGTIRNNHLYFRPWTGAPRRD